MLEKALLQDAIKMDLREGQGPGVSSKRTTALQIPLLETMESRQRQSGLVEAVNPRLQVIQRDSQRKRLHSEASGESLKVSVHNLPVRLKHLP